VQGDASASLKQAKIFPLFTVDEQDRVPGSECGAIRYNNKKLSAISFQPSANKKTRRYREHPEPTRTLDRGTHDTISFPSSAACRRDLFFYFSWRIYRGRES